MTVRSIHEPAFHAASTPIGIAASTETRRVEIVKATVGSIRCAIRVVTGRLVKIEMPRSPCSRRHTQDAELDIERLVEPERLVDAGDVGRGRGVAGDDRRRVAGAQMQEAEDEQRHDRHDRNGRKDAPDDIGEHRFLGADAPHPPAARVPLSPQRGEAGVRDFQRSP